MKPFRITIGIKYSEIFVFFSIILFDVNNIQMNINIFYRVGLEGMNKNKIISVFHNRGNCKRSIQYTDQNMIGNII